MTFDEQIEAFRKELGDEKLPRLQDIETVQAAVCAAFKIRRKDLKTKSLETYFVYPRFVSFYFCRRIPGMTLKRIARAHGNLDHVTVLHGIRRVEDLKTDQNFKWAFNRAEKLLTTPKE